MRRRVLAKWVLAGVAVAIAIAAACTVVNELAFAFGMRAGYWHGEVPPLTEEELSRLRSMRLRTFVWAFCCVVLLEVVVAIVARVVMRFTERRLRASQREMLHKPLSVRFVQVAFSLAVAEGAFWALGSFMIRGSLGPWQWRSALTSAAGIVGLLATSVRSDVSRAVAVLAAFVTCIGTLRTFANNDARLAMASLLWVAVLVVLLTDRDVRQSLSAPPD